MNMQKLYREMEEEASNEELESIIAEAYEILARRNEGGTLDDY